MIVAASAATNINGKVEEQAGAGEKLLSNSLRS